ncbi:hypothetical protein J3E68DRAFT_388311 [Trichoderma sp. SZMC 28012]
MEPPGCAPLCLLGLNRRFPFTVTRQAAAPARSSGWDLIPCSLADGVKCCILSTLASHTESLFSLISPHGRRPKAATHSGCSCEQFLSQEDTRGHNRCCS